MTRTSLILLIVSFAVAAGGAISFASFKGEINRAHAAVSNGSRIESTSAGPIEYMRQAHKPEPDREENVGPGCDATSAR